MMDLQERANLAEAIKEILVQMAIDNTLPIDMNDLDMDGVIEKAELNLSNKPKHVRLELLNKLGEYVSYDHPAELEMMLDNLLNSDNKPTTCFSNVEGVTPIASLEYSSMTVEELFDTIS